MPLLPFCFGPSRARVVVLGALLAAAAACGGEATGPGEDPAISSVVVIGGPASTMLVGDSVRLIATPVNESGGVVSNQRIAWSSSAPTVAAVRDNGTVLALGAGKTTITATIGGKSGTSPFVIADGMMVGTAGGTLSAAGSTISLAMPAGTVAQPTLLLMQPAENAPTDARLAGTAFQLGPDGVRFQRSATLTMKYDPAKIPAGLAEQSLQLYMQSGSGWVVVPGSSVDLTTKTVSAAIYGSGVYVVRSTPVDHILLSGAAVGGGLYAGQSSPIRAMLLDAVGDSLPTRPITWSSSDQSKVTVNASGNVTGVAAGTATITATTDGKSASTAVTVLTHPTADWSRATDWTTFQGDARHSGYIDVTLDPTAFHEQWVATPLAGVTYWQPTVGGGQVFLSVNSYFSAQTVVALDQADGSRKWTRDFGTIFGINQTTYDGGSVYVTSGGHEDTYMRALNATDGSLRFQTQFGSQWEHWKAPVVVGSTIVTAGGYYGGMYGFDRATGQQTFFLSGPQVDGWAPAAANGLVYATGYVAGGGVRALQPTDGTVASDIGDSRLTAVTTPVIGDANDLLTITGNRLVSVNLTTKQVAWEQSGGYTGMPVVGGGVVYAFSAATVTARRESDGALLWTWAPPTQYSTMRSLALTGNTLFVSVGGGYGSTEGATIAVDLTSHLAVWSYPMPGDIALGSQGKLFIVQGPKVAAIALR